MSDRSECPKCNWPTRGETPEEQAALDAFHAEMHIALDLEAQAKVHRDKAMLLLSTAMDAHHGQLEPVFAPAIFDDEDHGAVGKAYQLCALAGFKVGYLLSDPDDLGSCGECWILQDFGDHWGNIADVEDDDEATVRRAHQAVAFIVANGSAPSSEEFEAMGAEEAPEPTRPTREAAEAAIDAFLTAQGILGTAYSLVEDGDHGWAFWVEEEDTTSYVHADCSIEWYGTSWKANALQEEP